MTIAGFFSRQFQSFPRQELDDFFDRMQAKLHHTPDLARLQRRQQQLVFLYDDCMKSHPKHDEFIKEHGVMQATAFTPPKFSLWKKKLGPASFPVALPQEYSGSPLLPIKGELYSISTEQLIKLDKHKENMQRYIRSRVAIQVPYRAFVFLKERVEAHGEPGTEPELLSHVWTDFQVGTVNAWMYIGSPDYWCPQLDAGYLFSPVSRYFNIEQNRDYYYYSTQEYHE